MFKILRNSEYVRMQAKLKSYEEKVDSLYKELTEVQKALSRKGLTVIELEKTLTKIYMGDYFIFDKLMYTYSEYNSEYALFVKQPTAGSAAWMLINTSEIPEVILDHFDLELVSP